MRLKLKFLLTLVLLIVFTPLFLLSSRPVLASVSHIVRLYDDGGNPVQGATVILRTNEYDDTSTEWGKDCSRWVQYPGCRFDGCGYDTGPTWLATTDANGIAVFKMTDCSNASNCSGPAVDGNTQRCSTGWNRPLIVAVPYLNSAGHWDINSLRASIPIFAGGEQDYIYERKDDSSNASTLINRIADNVDVSDDDGHQGYLDFYNGWTLDRIFPRMANVVKTYISGGDGPGPKNSNIYWEWQWRGSTAANPQKENTLSFVDNFLASLKGLLRI